MESLDHRTGNCAHPSRCDDVGTDEPHDARYARVEVRHDDVDGVVITLHGDFGCRDVAVLSRHLHTELDASPARIVVDPSRLGIGDAAVRQVLVTAVERAEADGSALRLIDFGPPAAREQSPMRRGGTRCPI